MRSIKAFLKDKKNGGKLGPKTFLYLGVTAFLLFLCITYWPVAARVISGFIGAASPIIIGCVIAYPLNILMSFYERHYFKRSEKKFFKKSRRPVCLVLAIITLLAIVALVVGLVLPQFIECVKLIIDGFPGAAQKAVAFLEKHEILTENTISYLKGIDWKSWAGQAISIVGSGIGNVMEAVVSTVSSVFSGVVTGVLSVIFAVYVLAGKDKLGRQIDRVMKHYMKPKWYGRAKYAVGILDDCFHKYIVGQCIEAVILGVLCIVGMLILRLPYAPMIGALIALTALIPVAGAYIGAGVGAFLIFMESPIKAVIFLIFIIVLQQIEGNLIYPKVVGSSIGLPGIWVLAAVTVGGGVMGVGGMLLGVPIAAALYRMIRNDMNKDKNTLKGVEPDANADAECGNSEQVQ